MTREQIESMNGAEVDVYLAEHALGWTAEMRGAAERGGRGVENWYPHKCLDDAMQAAEKVGLEKNHHFFVLHFLGQLWQAGWEDGAENWLLETWPAPTPALAVCRAVISAHEARK